MIQVWWKNGGKFIKDTDLKDAFEVYISGIPVWRKNTGRNIKDTGLKEE